jgi:DNA-directed RNA polymerase subunit F
VTSLTDSVGMYRTRLVELEQERGTYDDRQAAMDAEHCLYGTSTDHLRELTFADRKTVHNLKYFTWVEQQGRTVDELNQLWSPHFWTDLVDLIPEWEEEIREFNQASGVLELIREENE